ncbi:MAG: TRAP transporter fused permease subunit [Chloroflexi bacterium]|nr:TRAP transporter fused permease subunit [Chloroflexota bacterium]
MKRDLALAYRHILALLGLLWAAFALYSGFTVAAHPLVQGPLFFALGTVFVFSHYPMTTRSSKRWPSSLDILAMATSIAISARAVLNYEEFSSAYYQFSNLDIICSVLVLLIGLEAVRRVFGLAVPIVALFFFTYLIWWGKFVPGVWGHAGISVDRALAQMYRGSEAYWGSITWIMATVVTVFIFFGPVLLASRGGETFLNLAALLARRIPGGPALVAVWSSLLFGTISGSAVANVIGTGTFTIPAMKKAGYRAEFAGAVEAASSTGGQIMPPIMGAAAFLMAEFLAIPYVSIMRAALIPAILYYLSITVAVVFHGRIKGMSTMPENIVPNATDLFNWKALVCITIPITVLMGVMLYTYSSALSASWALVTAILLHVSLGGSWSLPDLRKRLSTIGEALVSGAEGVATLIVLAVVIQVIVFAIGYSGLGVTLSAAILGLGESSLLPALIAAAVTAILLGMGMATAAAYVIAIAVVGPPLVNLGLAPLTAHMFVFYFAVLGALTPPVCPASVAAAAIAKADWIRLSLVAVALAAGGLIVPFLFVYNTSLLMEGPLSDILLSVLVAAAGIVLVAGGCMGNFLKGATVPERLGLGLSGLLLLLRPSTVGVLIGLAVVSLVLFSQLRRESQPQTSQEPERGSALEQE